MSIERQDAAMGKDDWTRVEGIFPWKLMIALVNLILFTTACALASALAQEPGAEVQGPEPSS